MRIVTNERLVQRNARIGQYASLAGVGLLVLALVLNLMAIFSGPNPSSNLLLYVVAAFFVGFTLSNIGTVFTNRWGRRPDRSLADALKGLDDRYTLYNFRLGASHVLVGPPGAVVLVPKFQTGPITFDGKRWRNPTGRRGFLGLFNNDPLGNPPLEAAGEAETFARFVKKHAPEVAVMPQAAVVFVNPRADVEAGETPLPVLHVKQLKDYVRKLPRDSAFPTSAVAALAD